MGRNCSRDGLDIRFLKTCREEIVAPLAQHFTTALRSQLPPLLRRGRTILLLEANKARGSADPSHYRPITLLPVLTRLLHKVVTNRVAMWLQQHSALNPVQAGFQPGRSTLEQAAVLVTLAGLQQAVQRELLMAILDIAAAFDFISHAQLIDVLHRIIGLPAEWVEVIRRLLIGLTTSIFESEIPITRGTPQGSPLSPLLCLCFMEDLCRSLLARGPCPNDIGFYDFGQSGELWLFLALLLFCDDVGCPAASPAALQWVLDGIREWTAKRDLRLSIKSRYTILASGASGIGVSDFDAGLESGPLQQATKPIYLGVPLDTLTNAAPHFRPRLNKQSTSYHLRRISERLTTRTGERFTNIRVYTTMVHQLVYARSLYSSPVMYVDTERLDTFINRMARIHFRLPRETSTVLLRTELHLLPSTYLVCIRRLNQAFSFFRSPLLQRAPAPAVGGATYRRHLPARPHLRRPASLYRRSGLRAHSVRRPALHLGAHSGPGGLHHHQRPMGPGDEIQSPWEIRL